VLFGVVRGTDAAKRELGERDVARRCSESFGRSRSSDVSRSGKIYVCLGMMLRNDASLQYLFNTFTYSFISIQLFQDHIVIFSFSERKLIFVYFDNK